MSVCVCVNLFHMRTHTELLLQVQATLQMVQHEKPFAMEVIEAPDPGDVFWPNISRTHKDLQLGSLFSLIATTALCLLWTIP